MSTSPDDDRYLAAARRVFAHLAETLDARFSVRLWDGSVIPLGEQADPETCLAIRDPGVLGSILRKPTLENIVRQYATGGIDVQGPGDLITFFETVRRKGDRTRGKSSGEVRKRIKKRKILRDALPLITAPKGKDYDHRFQGDDTGLKQDQRDEQAFIQFHYDLSNEFYALFLDPEMQYSCGYFTDWENGIDQAQQDKLEMICRKLRLQPGDRLLDIGSGWGGLLCHAARHYGIEGHGVTLSQAQYDFAVEKAKRLGLADKIRFDLCPYQDVEGGYDKIASIGMYEHVGIANYPAYFTKVRSLLRDRGIFLNHGITRRAKGSRRKFSRITPGRRFILKYIFPGSELDHIGHSLEVMETCGFDVHDVEGWREHYARTTRLWCRRLEENRERAIELVGRERFRMWIGYLAGVSFAFHDGSLRIFQTVASKHDRKGSSELPPTRADLYRD